MGHYYSEMASNYEDPREKAWRLEREAKQKKDRQKILEIFNITSKELDLLIKYLEEHGHFKTR